MNQLLSLPNLKFIHAIPSLIFVMLLIHLPYMSIILGSSFFSTIYHRWKPAASKDLINLVLEKRWVWIFFGFLPPLAIAFLYNQLLSTMKVPIYLYFLIILVIQVLGFTALSIYRRKDNHNAGVIGLLFITAYCYYVIVIISLMFFPERWYYLNYVKSILPYPLFYITPVIDFTNFLCLSLITTGAAILFFYFQWPGKSEKHLSENAPHYIFLKRHGYGLILAGSLIMPLIIIWHLFNLPGYSLSLSVYILAVIELILLAATVLVVIIILWSKNENLNHLQKYNFAFFIAAILMFALWISIDNNLQSNARRDIIVSSEENITKTQTEIESKREEKQFGNVIGSEQLGEQIYKNTCSKCHSFDQKVWGPPYNHVMPKYYGHPKELEDFIRNPKKVDPNYPAMPNLGLNSVQIKSIIFFLMKELGKRAIMGIESIQESQSVGPPTPGEQMGEKIYEKVCHACHNFDQRSLGPPYNSVLTRYYDNLEKLENFIKSPTKIDPGYPAMPNLGLDSVQTKSVVIFLMKKMGRKVEDDKTVPIKQPKSGDMNENKIK